MTLKVQEAWFSDASVAVIVTAVVPTLKLSPELWVCTTVGLGSALSLAVIAGHSTVADICPVGATAVIADAGQPRSVGGVESPAGSTVITTVKLQVAAFPAASVKVIETGVVPGANRSPDSWLAVLASASPELSVAVMLGQVTMLEEAPAGALTSTVDRHPEMTGAVESAAAVTVTSKVISAVLPDASLKT